MDDVLEIVKRIKEKNGIKIKSLRSSNNLIYSKIGLLMLLQERMAHLLDWIFSIMMISR
jgi:hypothetical protein